MKGKVGVVGELSVAALPFTTADGANDTKARHGLVQLAQTQTRLQALAVRETTLGTLLLGLVRDPRLPLDSWEPCW